MNAKGTLVGLMGLWALAAGCNNDVSGPQMGAARVTIATAGADLNPHGYVVGVDGGASMAAPVNGSVTIVGLKAGSHSLALGGLAGNCAVSGANPRSVDVVAGGTTDVSFAITCASTARTGPIAFVSDRDGNADIYVMNADGSSPTRLTNNPAADLDPAWSPDGTKIAFASNRDGNYTIYVMNADGSNPSRLTAGRAPAWSPDGKKIAFTVDVGAGVEGELSYVYSMNADGTGGTYIAGDYWPYEAASDPAWSPDGARLALRLREFWDEVGYVTYIVVMRADGTNWRYVAYSSDDGGGTVASPAWSPDGTKITFISYDRVSVVGDDGFGEHALTTGTENNESSVWSPDGTQIVFSGACVDACSGALDIYVMNADGSGVVRLTDRVGRNYAPAWRH